MICMLLVAGHGTILETQIKVNQLMFSPELQKLLRFLNVGARVDFNATL